MFNLYFGTDSIKVREKGLNYADKISTEIGATINKIDSEEYSAGMLADMLGAVSLFGNKEVFVLDTPSLNAEFEKEVFDSLFELKESINQFIILEAGLLAPQKKKYEKYADLIEEFKRDKEVSFDVWAMADSLSRRDKKNLWVLLEQAKRAGLSAEEIIGTLWWQLKTLKLASLTKNASEAGMKDFPYNKAKRSLVNFKSNDLDKIMFDLLVVYHEGHGGIKDINIGLEEWVLRG